MSRATRRLTVGLAATTLTAGLAAAPATAAPATEDLPENSSGISAPNGWTPEGSVPAWIAMSGWLGEVAIQQPGTALLTSLAAPALIALSGNAPLVPWCGSMVDMDSPQEGC